MLQTMRHLAQSWVFKGLMMILVVSFGIWGIGDIFRGNPLQRSVAKVGSDSVNVQDLQRQFDTMLTQMRRSFGPEVTVEQAKGMGLLGKALEFIVTRDQIDLETEHLGIDVTQKEALDWLTSQPELRNKDGSVDRDMLYREAQREGIREEDLVKQWQHIIAQRELFFPFDHSGDVPQIAIDTVTKAEGQKRILEIVTIDDEKMSGVPAPDDKALHAFYDKNQDTFTAPEYRGITVAELSTDELLKDVALSDDEVKKEYDAHIDQYSTPERRDILQVVLPDADKAKQLAAAAHASGDLAAAAQAQSLKAMPVNQIEEKGLPPQLAAPIFALKSGQISDVVQSPLGWHVIQLKAVTAPAVTPFEKVKNDLRDTLRHDRAIDTATRLANELDDDLAGGKSLEDIADNLHLRLIKVAALDAHDKTDAGKDPPDLPAKKQVLDNAFAQNAGEVSPVIDDKNGNYIVVRTDQVVPSAVRPFDKVRDQIVAAWKAQEQQKLAADEAEKVAKSIRAGASPSSFAQLGFEARVSKPISLLGDSDPSLPAQLLPQIEKMKKGEVITAAIPGHQVVLQLTQLVDLDAAAVKAASLRMETDIQRQAAEEFISEYRDYLNTRYPPRIDQDVFDQMRQQGG